MASSSNTPAPLSQPLHSAQVDPLTLLNRAHAAVYSCAVLAHLLRRAAAVPSAPAVVPAAFLLLADAVLGFMWFLGQAFRWRPLRRRAHPERIPPGFPLPALDVFVCTADPHKEPPLAVASAVLSALAFDYPADKLSVYVSDDGGSALTLFAFMEAAKFARHWLPFCRENGVEERCPEAYFRATADKSNSLDIEILYKNMKEKVECVMETGFIGHGLLFPKDELNILRSWNEEFSPQEHPASIQVLLRGGEDLDVSGNLLPSLVYVSREKRRASPHHFKAGALNTLLRVSSVMSDAPFILTLDCDVISNDPKAPLQALCFFFDKSMAKKLAFVQFPQRFNKINKNDTYGVEMKRLLHLHPEGMDGLDGPDYQGSGTFFSRNALVQTESMVSSSTSEYSSPRSDRILNRAREVASCTFEQGTAWGSMIGFRYGSLVEDYFTGYRLHCEGWKSVLCDPTRPTFIGEAPINIQDVLTQLKRWVVGLLEVAFSKYFPLCYGVRRISLLMSMCYAYHTCWPSWFIPMFIYGIIPQLALLYQVPLFPKASDPWFILCCYLFAASYAQDFIDFLRAGGNPRQWWNEQRVWMIRGVTCFPLGIIEFTLKELGISIGGFEITNKVVETEQRERYEKGLLEFGVTSPITVSITTFSLISLTAFIVAVLRAFVGQEDICTMAVQIFISGFVTATCLPIYHTMFIREDSGKMPGLVVLMSTSIVGILYTIGYFVFIS